MKRCILAFPLLLLCAGCNSSPGQFEGRVSPVLALCYVDCRQYIDGSPATNLTNTVPVSGGPGSNARVHSESIQSMVFHKSPMSASSNSTDLTASIPLVK